MQPNRLRSAIDRDEPSLGTRILSVWPGIIEVLGQTDTYDYVEFAGEYAPYDLHDLDALGRATELAGVSSMIKIDAQPREFLAQRAMAAGFQNLLFADIRTAEDAEAAVAAVRPEPIGQNGIRMDRRNGYVGGYARPAEVVEFCEDAVVAVMVEKQAAVENLEAILAVEGIDMVQFGPADYALSLGRPGETGISAVRDAERRTIEAAIDAGVVPRAEITDPADVDHYRSLGVDHYSLHTDVRILYEWWRTNGRTVRDAVTASGG